MFPSKVYALLALAFGVVAVGDYLTKRWTQGAGQLTFLSAWLCYTIVSGIWFLVMREQPTLGRVGVVWTTAAMVASVFIGVVFFSEALSPTNKLGVLLCILGVILTSV